jgi:hypothetical protein
MRVRMATVHVRQVPVTTPVGFTLNQTDKLVKLALSAADELWRIAANIKASFEHQPVDGS